MLYLFEHFQSKSVKNHRCILVITAGAKPRAKLIKSASVTNLELCFKLSHAMKSLNIPPLLQNKRRKRGFMSNRKCFAAFVTHIETHAMADSTCWSDENERKFKIIIKNISKHTIGNNFMTLLQANSVFRHLVIWLVPIKSNQIQSFVMIWLDFLSLFKISDLIGKSNH